LAQRLFDLNDCSLDNVDLSEEEDLSLANEIRVWSGTQESDGLVGLTSFVRLLKFSDIGKKHRERGVTGILAIEFRGEMTTGDIERGKGSD
jgi:hypothetical protein